MALPAPFPPSFSRPSWAEINLSSLRANARLISGARSTPLIAVIKANAYGHGAVEVARALEDEALFFAVASVDEGRVLRHAGIEKKILLLSTILPEEAQAALDADLMPTLSTLEVAQALNDAAKSQNKMARAHWKIDTGMGRVGPFYPHAAEFWRELQEYSNLQIEGVYTHFACADENGDCMTLRQVTAFEKALFACEISPEKYLIHAANSAATLRFPQAHFGAVRCGIALYGTSPYSDRFSGKNVLVDPIFVDPFANPPIKDPSEDYRVEWFEQASRLLPAMSLKARVTEIREISAGRTVSYGATWTAKRDSKLALVPLGYADGYSRQLSNCGEVLLRGKRCPVVGRVTMDQIFVDVTEISPNIQTGEVVTAWGRDEAGVLLPVEQVAAWAETISYELLCGVAPRIPRIYID